MRLIRLFPESSAVELVAGTRASAEGAFTPVETATGTQAAGFIVPPVSPMGAGPEAARAPERFVDIIPQPLDFVSAVSLPGPEAGRQMQEEGTGIAGAWIDLNIDGTDELIITVTGPSRGGGAGPRWLVLSGAVPDLDMGNYEAVLLDTNAHGLRAHTPHTAGRADLSRQTSHGWQTHRWAKRYQPLTAENERSYNEWLALLTEINAGRGRSAAARGIFSIERFHRSLRYWQTESWLQPRRMFAGAMASEQSTRSRRPSSLPGSDCAQPRSSAKRRTARSTTI